MSSHTTLANWYTQIAQQLEAGISLVESLVLSQGPSEKDRIRLSAQLESGATIDETLQNAPKWLPLADRIFISAAAETGRLPQTFLNLAERHTRLNAIKRKVAISLFYPIAVLHIAALALPMMRMIDFETGIEWSLSKHIMMSSAILVPLWCVIGLFYAMSQSKSPLIPRLLRCLPLLRQYSKLQSIADFALSLSAFLETGLPIQSAWQAAVHISRDPALSKAYKQLRPTFDAGEDPGSRMKEIAVFPSELVAFYQAGQRSGQLDQTLLKAGNRYQENAIQALNTAAVTYPVILFVCVAACIIYSIFQIYGGYLSSFSKILE